MHETLNPTPYIEPDNNIASRSVEYEPITSEYKFVFCEHTTENSDEIAKALGDCDVIAWEMVGLNSDFDREDRSYELGQIFNSKSSTEDKSRAKEVLGEANDGFVLSVFSELENTDKTLEIIDVTKDDDEYNTVRNYMTTDFNLHFSMYSSKPLESTKSALSDHIYSTAQMILARDKLIVKQLKQIGRDNPGKKIGVMTGYVHTGVQHEISQYAKTGRTFIVNDGDAAEQSSEAKYSLADEAVRSIRFGKTLPDKDTIDRILVEELFVEIYGKQSAKQLHNRTAKLTNEDIKTILDAYEAIKIIKDPDTTNSMPLRAIKIKLEVKKILESD